jgi:hypothetical protein
MVKPLRTAVGVALPRTHSGPADREGHVHRIASCGIRYCMPPAPRGRAPRLYVFSSIWAKRALKRVVDVRTSGR